MRLFIAGCISLVCTTICAKTVNSHLTDDYLQNLNEDTNLSININQSSGYFTKHHITEVYTDNPYLYAPNFTTAVSDSGFYENHEDINNFIDGLITPVEDTHGTAVLNLSFGGNLDNGLGTLSLVNAFTKVNVSARTSAMLNN